MPCQACGCRNDQYKKLHSKYLCKKHYNMFKDIQKVNE